MSYISREAAIELGYWHGEKPTVDNPFPDGVDAVDIVDIENLPAADVREEKWISVKERLPEPLVSVLLVVRRMGKEWCHDSFISTGYLSMDKVSWWCSHDGDCTVYEVEVTHWQPLPAMPKEDEA